MFGSLAINGVVSIGYSLAYRQPLVFFWTIPGTVLVGPALDHLTLPAGDRRLHRHRPADAGARRSPAGCERAMAAIPMPIVMGMVAGVFLDFGLDWVRAFRGDLAIAAAMTAAFLAVSALPAGAPLAAAADRGARRRRPRHLPVGGTFAPALEPASGWPRRASRCRILLGGDGRAGRAAGDHRAGGAERPGHRRADRGRPRPARRPDRGRLRRRLASSRAFVGAVPTCLTGPVNAIISASGERHGQYTAGVVVGLLGGGLRPLAPLVTRLMLSTPPAFIATLAGLAMLRVLQ